MIGWSIFIGINVLLTVYTYQLLKRLNRNKWFLLSYLIVSIFVFLNFIHQFFFIEDRTITVAKSFASGTYLVFFMFNLFTLPFLFLEDFYRVIVFILRRLFKRRNVKVSLESRRKFVSKLAVSIASIPFVSLIYGMIKGKYNYKIFVYELYFDDLPKEFDGYKITQFSDLHIGSFTNQEKVREAMDLINKQQSDVIFFTGDMVNNSASELYGWHSVLSKLKAKDGLYSVLGNHDYGDYFNWKSTADKQANFEKLKIIQKELGFKLLLNESVYLQKSNSKIALIGVENWGRGRFKKAGDLEKASENIEDKEFKILLSHDPTHWSEKVLPNKKKYHLTLSGHTHGMQFGIEVPGFRWSPAKWQYKEWAGLYEENGEFINVNRGIGFLGYPGRVGIWPEVTVIKLKRRI